MLTGTPAFDGATNLEVLHATVHEAPRALGGSRTIESVNRIVRRLLAKNPDQRPASALVAAEELKSCLVLGDAAIRVTTQLVGAPGGEVLWSHAAHATLRDVFQLQDDLVQRIVSSLSLPLTAREQQLLKHDVPANPTAYELFLRGNQLQQQATLASLDAASLAKDLYLRSLEADPQYAPAWVNLGRCYRCSASPAATMPMSGCGRPSRACSGRWR